MDAKLNQYLQQYQEKKDAAEQPDSDTESLSELMEELENEDEVVTRYREQRMEQIKREVSAVDAAKHALGDQAGSLNIVSSEKELMDAVVKTPTAIVHFFQPTFARCKAMNEVLRDLAEKHMSLHVMAITAENAPFLVSKLSIKVLPFLLIYKNGQELARSVGFEGLEGGQLSLDSLENKLMSCGAIARKSSKTIRASKPRATEDLDDDWY